MFSRIIYRLILFYHRKLKNNTSSLKSRLIATGQTRWLDLGSSSNLTEGFYFADLHAPSEAPEAMREKYVQLDIVNASEDELSRIGKFDLIRMQHIFEHFTMEDGIKVLERCAALLNTKGYLLITVPDLEIFIRKYRCANLQSLVSFKGWALNRIPENAPQSFYFSIFTHSVLHQQHLWCYDEEGVRFQLNRTGKYNNIRRLSLFDPMANIPFTHNRPDEDLCMIAQKA